MLKFIRKLWSRHSVRWLNHGKPPSKMNYDYALRFGWTPFYEALPDACGQCGSSAFEEVKSLMVIGDYGGQKYEQPDVIVRSCPMGHGFSVWLA